MTVEPASRQTRPSWRGRREVALDAALALAVFAGSLALLAARGDSGADTRELDALAVLLAALASLPLVAWRREPLAVFAITAAASAALNGLGYPPGPPLGPTIALYLLALSPKRTRAPRWVVGVVVPGVFVIHVSAVAIAEDEFPTVPLLFGALVWGGAWVIGDRVRLRRERIVELEERARRAEREAERERRLAAAEERTRIARDLHDSAGHAINVILVQAGAARLLSERDPERAQAASRRSRRSRARRSARSTSSSAPLREDELPERGANVEPPPGLAALETLAERHRAAGLDVTRPRRGPAASAGARSSTRPPTASSRRRSPTRPATGTAAPRWRSTSAEALELP